MKTSNSPSYISCLVVFLGSLILKVVSENFIPQNARTDSFSRFDWDDQRRGPHSIYHRSGREPQTSTVFFPHRLWATIWQVWYEPATEEKVVCPRCKGRRKIYRKTIGCWLCQGSRFFTTQKSLKLAVKRFGDNGNVTEFWLPPDSQKLSRRVDCNVGRFFATLTLCSSPKFIVSDSDPWVLWRNKQRTRRRCCKPWNSRVLPKT